MQLEQALARLSRGSSGEDVRTDEHLGDFDGDSSASEDDTVAREAELRAAAAAKAAKVAKRAYEAANATSATAQAALAAATAAPTCRRWAARSSPQRRPR
jgi:aminopeptidase N